MNTCRKALSSWCNWCIIGVLGRFKENTLVTCGESREIITVLTLVMEVGNFLFLLVTFLMRDFLCMYRCFFYFKVYLSVNDVQNSYFFFISLYINKGGEILCFLFYFILHFIGGIYLSHTRKTFYFKLVQ